MEVSFGVALALAIAIFGGGGGIWVLLRFGREEAAANIAVQSGMLDDTLKVYHAVKAEHAAVLVQRDEATRLYEATVVERDRCHLECIRLREELTRHRRDAREDLRRQEEEIRLCRTETEALRQELGRRRNEDD